MMRNYLIKNVLPFWLNSAIDEEFGGIFTQLDRDGNIYGEEKYLAAYNDLKVYTEKYFKDAECGEWYGYLYYDNTPSTTLKGNIFKGPFHLPRMLILIDKIEKGESVL